MKNLYCFEITPTISLEQAWEELEQTGVEVAYGAEEEKGNVIYGYLNASQLPVKLTSVMDYHLTILPAINWEEQWEAHGLNYHDGFVHVDLSQFSPCSEVLRLQAGPGFGDVSHPTTCLVLSLMSSYIQSGSLIDIGCGSGILALAGLKMGAQEVFCIDIDPDALEHTRVNARINSVEHQCHFYLSEEWKERPSNPVTIVVNMISSEQQLAWMSLPQLEHVVGYVISSGIRAEERESYLKQVSKWHWILIKEQAHNGWLGFVFRMDG